MSWLKENLFISFLAVITLIVCATLTIFAKSGSSRYQAANESFQSAYSEIRSLERIPLYPSSSSRDAKKKALDDYRSSIIDLQGSFSGYRSVKLPEMTTQEFTSKLKATRKEIVSEYKATGVKIPENFFLGFEGYRGTLANSDAVGILSYQLDIVNYVNSELAKAKPTELIRFYREELPEESGEIYSPENNEIARTFGYEITFKGSEKSVREFLNSLGVTSPYYLVVRSIRISNENGAPPKITDAKFEVDTAEVEVEAGSVDNFFGTNDSSEPTTEEEEDSQAPQLDTSRILTQVLGREDVEIFIRFDATLFAEAPKTLPEL